MIKTLRFTTIIVGIVALAAVILVAYPMVFGHGVDEEVKAFLESPGVIELFKARRDKLKKPAQATSPLVQEAKRFGLYLDPPPKVVKQPRKSPSRTARKEKAAVKTPPRVSPKFKLVMTSYSSSRPELSRAMIDQPGKGVYWVKEQSKVGHLEIAKIKDGVVVVKDSSKTYEVEVPPKEQKSLLRSRQVSTGVKSESRDRITLPGEKTGKNNSGSGKVERGKVSSSDTYKPPVGDTNVRGGIPDGIPRDAGEIPGSEEPTEEHKERVKNLLSFLENMRVNTQESQGITDLGKQLEEESKQEPQEAPKPSKPPVRRRPRSTRRPTKGR
ncbi:MAG: hypothetical protein ACYTBP_10685 [Planctomycetota bacterium]|jgi:hypothetical protein